MCCINFSVFKRWWTYCDRLQTNHFVSILVTFFLLSQGKLWIFSFCGTNTLSIWWKIKIIYITVVFFFFLLNFHCSWREIYEHVACASDSLLTNGIQSSEGEYKIKCKQNNLFTSLEIYNAIISCFPWSLLSFVPPATFTVLAFHLTALLC